MAQGKESADFNLIIEQVDADRLDEASTSLAKAFGLDDALAGQIVKAAPIVFATRLTKAEVKAITPKLAELSSRGMEFRVTARVPQKMPKVNWPVRPQFTAGGSGGPNGLAFEWDNNAFVCPSCGETFLFRRLGKLKLAEAPAAPPPRASKAAPGPASKAPPPAEEKVDVVDEAADIAPPEPMDESEVIELEGESPLPGEGESLELPEPGPEPEVGAEQEFKLEEAPAEAEEAPAGPVLSQAGAPLELEEQVEEVREEAAPAGEGQPAAAGGDDGGERYNVFLSKITDRSRQDKVAELISKVKGCSMNEARDLTTRLVIPIAKNVPKEQAEDILGQFKKIKVFGRMTKVK